MKGFKLTVLILLFLISISACGYGILICFKLNLSEGLSGALIMLLFLTGAFWGGYLVELIVKIFDQP